MNTAAVDDETLIITSSVTTRYVLTLFLSAHFLLYVLYTSGSSGKDFTWGEGLELPITKNINPKLPQSPKTLRADCLLELQWERALESGNLPWSNTGTYDFTILNLLKKHNKTLTHGESLFSLD